MYYTKFTKLNMLHGLTILYNLGKYHINHSRFYTNYTNIMVLQVYIHVLIILKYMHLSWYSTNYMAFISFSWYYSHLGDSNMYISCIFYTYPCYSTNSNGLGEFKLYIACINSYNCIYSTNSYASPHNLYYPCPAQRIQEPYRGLTDRSGPWGGAKRRESGKLPTGDTITPKNTIQLGN